MDVSSHLLSERVVYLGTEIDDGVVQRPDRQILHLEADSPEQPITSTSTRRAAPSAILALYGGIEYCRPPIATTCIGQACSTAAILLAAGAPPDGGASSRTPGCCCTSRRPVARAPYPT